MRPQSRWTYLTTLISTLIHALMNRVGCEEPNKTWVGTIKNLRSVDGFASSVDGCDDVFNKCQLSTAFVAKLVIMLCHHVGWYSYMRNYFERKLPKWQIVKENNIKSVGISFSSLVGNLQESMSIITLEKGIISRVVKKTSDKQFSSIFFKWRKWQEVNSVRQFW